MPCYLFTWHTYGSWMPDRPRGYVRRDVDGVLPKDDDAAKAYRERMRGDAVLLSGSEQKQVVAVLRSSAEPLSLRFHAVGVDPTHVHALVSWTDGRGWEAIRRSLRSSLTRGLNERVGKRVWFGRGGSRKRVVQPQHFDRLMRAYLPGHHAVFWREGDTE
ncbi:MAG: hypothetical protein AAF710_05620 [Planctomycetota bacterium]